MKEYRLGETIYIKGTVGQIDENDHEQPYGVSFVEKTYGVQTWPNRSAIIDELPTAEPVKPVLPKEVGEELDIAKNELQISFDGYITDVLDHQGSFRNSFEYYSIHFEVIAKLADAWRYGWEAEKEPKYLVWVKLPDTGAQFYKERLNGQPRWERRDKTELLEASWYQFTKSEVEQLKSDYPYIEINEVTEDEI